MKKKRKKKGQSESDSTPILTVLYVFGGAQHSLDELWL